MEHLFCDKNEAVKLDLYNQFMQDRTEEAGISFYLYRLLLESLPKEI